MLQKRSGGTFVTLASLIFHTLSLCWTSICWTRARSPKQLVLWWLIWKWITSLSLSIFTCQYQSQSPHQACQRSQDKAFLGCLYAVQYSWLWRLSGCSLGPNWVPVPWISLHLNRFEIRLGSTGSALNNLFWRIIEYWEDSRVEAAGLFLIGNVHALFASISYLLRLLVNMIGYKVRRWETASDNIWNLPGL